MASSTAVTRAGMKEPNVRRIRAYDDRRGRDWADDLRGRALDCGYYLAEEAPELVAAELADFLAA